MVKAKCEICDRNFKNEDGLAMHNTAKHSDDMQKNKSNAQNKSEIKHLPIK